MNLKEEIAFLIELGGFTYITSGMYLGTGQGIIHKHFFSHSQACDDFVRYVMDAKENTEIEKFIEEVKEKGEYLGKIQDSMTRYSTEFKDEMVGLTGESYGISLKILKKIKKLIEGYSGVTEYDIGVVFYKKTDEKGHDGGYIGFTRKRDDGGIDCFALFPGVYMPIKVGLFD